MNQVILLAVAIMLTFTVNVVPVPVKRGAQFQGHATFYAPGLGACGITNSAQDLIVALNVGQFTSNSVCNQVVSITGPKGTIQCTITDKCPGCGYGCLDLSPAAFDKIGDESAGVVDITWSFVGGSGGNNPPQQTSTKPTPKPTPTPTTTSSTSTTTSSTTSTSTTSPTTSTTKGTSPSPSISSKEIKLSDIINCFYNGTVASYNLDSETFSSPT